MSTEAKVREVEDVVALLRDARSVVLADFTGLDVAAVSALRRKCRDAGVHYRVIKNTLARRATAQTGMAAIDPLLQGPNAWAIHPSDQVAAAKVLREFAKDQPNLMIRGGFVDGRLVSVQEVETLAKLPGRDVLLAQTLAVLQGPMVGFASVLTSLLRGFATVADAYAKKRAESGS